MKPGRTSLDLAQLSDLGRLQVEKTYSTWLTLDRGPAL